MAQAVAEDAPIAIVTGPDDRQVLVRSMDTLPGQVDLAGVESQQHANPGPREILDLVDLVADREVAGQVSHAGEAGILHHQRGVELTPGVAVKVSAEHLAVL